MVVDFFLYYSTYYILSILVITKLLLHLDHQTHHQTLLDLWGTVSCRILNWVFYRSIRVLVRRLSFINLHNLLRTSGFSQILKGYIILRALVFTFSNSFAIQISPQTLQQRSFLTKLCISILILFLGCNYSSERFSFLNWRWFHTTNAFMRRAWYISVNIVVDNCSNLESRWRAIVLWSFTIQSMPAYYLSRL